MRSLRRRDASGADSRAARRAASAAGGGRRGCRTPNAGRERTALGTRGVPADRWTSRRRRRPARGCPARRSRHRGEHGARSCRRVATDATAVPAPAGTACQLAVRRRAPPPSNSSASASAPITGRASTGVRSATMETHDRLVGRTYREAARTCEAQLGGRDGRGPRGAPGIRRSGDGADRRAGHRAPGHRRRGQLGSASRRPGGESPFDAGAPTCDTYDAE